MQVFENVAKQFHRNELRFTPDGRSLVLGALPLVFVDTADGSSHALSGMKVRWAWAIIRNGAALAYLFSREAVQILDLKTLEEQTVYTPNLVAREMATDLRGERLFLSPGAPFQSIDTRVWMLNTTDLTPQAEFFASDEPVHRLCTSADGNWLAAWHTPGNKLRAWHVGGSSWPPTESMCVPTTHMNHFAMSADGSHLAAVGSNGLSIWKTNGGEEVVRSGKHRRGVLALACNPAKPILATGDSAGQVFLWDYAGNVLTRFNWELGQVYGLAFAPDGLRCAAIDDTGKVVIWDVDV